AGEVDSGAGGGGDADHEIAGGGGNLEGDAHGLVHGEDLDRSRADAEQSGESAGAEHDRKAERDAMDGVGLQALDGGTGTIEAQEAGERVRVFVDGNGGLGSGGQVGRVEEDEAEDDGNGGSGDVTGDESSGDGTQGSGNF